MSAHIDTGGASHLVDTPTGEILDVLSAAEAERLTMRISLKLDAMADAYAGVMPLIREAIDGQAHVVLGYRSVAEYVADRFGGALTKLGVDMRREVVRELTDAGMSKRAIAPVVGVTHQMISKDIKATQVATELPPAQDGAGAPVGADSPEAYRFESDAAPTTSPIACGPVVGIDGKTYTRPTPVPVAVEADQRHQDLRFLDALGRDLGRLGLSAWMPHEDRIAELIRNKVGIYALIDGGLSNEIDMARSSLAFLERIQAKATDKTLRRIK